MVYRPPKKKAEGPGFPANRPQADPLEGPLQGQGDSGVVLKGDDRRLVMVDQNFQEADFEDRVWLFWRKQQSLIYTVLAGALAVVAVWQGSQYYQKIKLSHLQSDYLAAVGPAALQSFAQDHAGTPLAQVAMLEAADGFYQKSQYKDAVQAYAQAVTLWGDEPYAQRARVGGAMALVLSGDEAGGRKQLEAVAADTQIADNFRAQADYFSALLSLKASDIAGAQKWIASIKGLPQGGEWVSEATSLETLVPALADAKASAPMQLSNPGSGVMPGAPASSAAASPIVPVSPAAASPVAVPATPTPVAVPASPAPSGSALALPKMSGAPAGNSTATPAK